MQEVGQSIQTLSTPVIEQVIEPEELDMPRVFFYGDALPTSKTDVLLTMDYISNTDRFSSYIKLKCQGTSSMSYAKKNFTINMYSDEARETKLKKNFKGWGNQSKFCLKANWVDSTHTRNISGARIGYDMVASRPDSAFKQQLLTAPRYGLVDGFPIKVYFNGEFHGIYTWNIPKDGWMFNMDKDNPNHIVLCAEKNTDGNSSAINSCQFRQLWDGGGDWSYEFGTASDTVKNSLNRCIGFVMNATDQEFHDNISEYFDLYSLLDYYCFSYLTCHLDGLAKNMLMITYDGIIWGVSLYDMDSIYGVHWNGSTFVATNYQCPEQYQEQFSRLWVRIEQCFATELYARYLELRQGALSLSNIIKHVEEIYDVIPDRVFADEKVKWTNIPQVSTNTMTRFRNYMRDRAVYVDAQMLEIGTRVACTGITLDQTNIELTANNTTVTLVATVEPSNTTDTITWSSNAISIATVNNGLVTAKANGSAVITATCGSQSATCNVTVSGMSEGGGDTPSNLVFQVDSTSMNTSNNTLTDNISGISATLTGNPTVSGNQIAFTAGDVFNFDLGSLNLPSSNRTLRIKFTPTTLDTNTRNVIGLGSAVTQWDNMTTCYITSEKLLLQHGSKGFTNNTVGTIYAGNSTNRLSTPPVTGQEYELVISENIDGNIKWFIDGTLVQDGTTTFHNPLYLSNTEGDYRFVGNYSLIEIYDEYCDTYDEFTAMANRGSGITAEYYAENLVFDGVDDYIDTGIQLFDTAKDFTIYIDYTPTDGATQSNQATVFHCIHEASPYRGLTLMIKSDTIPPYMIGGQASGSSYLENIGAGNHKYLIEFTNGVINSIKTVDGSNNVVDCTLGDGVSNSPYVNVTENLLLGCYQSTTGSKGRFWNGTINKFGVWFKTLTNDEIKNLTGCNNVEVIEDSTIETTYTNGYIARSTGHISGGNVSLGEIITTNTDITSDFIPCVNTDTFTLNVPSTQYGCGVVAYDSSQSYLYTYTTSKSWSYSPTNEADITGITVEVNNLPENTAYIRICANTTDSSSVTITKHSIVYY